MIKNTKKLTVITLTNLLVFSLAIPTTFANEIHYSTVEEVRGENVSVHYKGPWGEEFFSCNVSSGDCTSYGTTTPEIFPEINDQTDYPNSPDGRYAVVQTTDEEEVEYALYRMGDRWHTKNSSIPYNKPASRITFSPTSSHVFLFGPEKEVARFEISSGELEIFKLPQETLPLRIVSPQGRYLSFYNYTDQEHVIFDFAEKEEFRLPGEKAAFVEFSENEQWAVFTDDKEGFETLYLVDLVDSKPEPARIFAEDFTVVDYLFLDNKLYYISNEPHPYLWSLYEYDPVTKDKRKISGNVSYADYIRRISNRLQFLIINDKNTDVALYDPSTKKIEEFRPMERSPLPSIQREVLKIGDNQAALLSPTNKETASGDLFIWLHGGPQRQTSPAYHSYLSYAVYDELLDRLVESGALVLKLDYTGSWGYGKKFIDALEENIGNVDVNDVIQAAEEMVEKNTEINNIYLIGNSYGGYLAARTTVEKPETFAGAISINGVLDWFSLIERIPSSPFARLFNGTPDVKEESNLELYQKANISNKLRKLSDEKLLLVLGEEDSTVPTWQTTEFYADAKAQGVDVELLSFSDEDHILRNRQNLDTLCEEIVDWADLNDEICEN